MDKKALLEEIIKWGQAYPEKQPGDVTVKDYADAVGVEVSTARRRLNRMVSEGKLTKLKVEHGMWVYRKP